MGVLPSTRQIHGRTTAFVSTDKNASARLFGDHAAPKKPTNAAPSSETRFSVADATSMTPMLPVGGLGPSQRPGRVISTAARLPSADHAIDATRSMRKRSSGRITRPCATNAWETATSNHSVFVMFVIGLDCIGRLRGSDQ